MFAEIMAKSDTCGCSLGHALESCQGGRLFQVGENRPSGYTWMEARDVCATVSATLPLGSRFPLLPNSHQCFLQLFQQISSADGGNVNIWSDTCTADQNSCGRFVLFHNLASFSRYAESTDPGTRSHFNRVICQQGNSLFLKGLC